MDFVVVAHWRAAKRDPKVTHRGAQPQEKPPTQARAAVIGTDETAEGIRLMPGSDG